MSKSSNTNHECGAQVTHAAELQCLVATSLSLEPTGDGPLSGRSFVVKDLVDVAGHVSSFGHTKWRETHDAAEAHAPVLVRLLQAGGQMCGLTKMDQLAYSIVGNVGEGAPPVNPLTPDRFTGGSSSGSASAVAGRVADFGIGTDTAGSIRVPAASCGLYGIRPTHGAVDSTGVIPLGNSFDVVGILARSALLLRDVFEVVSDLRRGREPRVAEVLIPRDILALLVPELAEAVVRAAEALARENGGTIGDVEFAEFTEAAVGDTLARLQGREIWRNHSTWIEAHREHLAADVATRLDRCKQWSLATDGEKNADVVTRQKYQRRYEGLVGAGRVLAIPVMAGRMPLRSSSDEALRAFRLDAFRLIAPGSLCGAPQVIVPVQVGSSGSVWGVGFMGPRGSDRALLDAVVAATKGAERFVV